MIQKLSTRSRRRTALCVFGVLALVGAACSGDDSGGSGSSDGGGGDEEATIDVDAILGDENPTSGEPIQIGWIDDGVTDTIDHTAQRVAAEAAAEYVNDYLGGVAGRPIELDICSTDQTPSGASDCVAQFARTGVPIALNGVTGQAADLFVPLTEVGILSFITGAGDQEAISTEGISILGNGISALIGGQAQRAAEEGVERAALIVIDVPAASGLLEEVAPLFYDNAGVEVDVVTVAPETPDMTPNVQAALSQDPGQFAVIGDAAFCGKAMDALAAVNYEGRIMVIPDCLDATTRESVSNWEGVEVLTTDTTDPDSEEYQLYQAVMQKYAGADAELGAAAPRGYQAVVGFARAMADLTGEVNSETIAAAFASMPPTPMPLADGITYQCNRQQVSIAPNFCSIDVLQTTLDADGNGTEYELFDGEEAVSLG